MAATDTKSARAAKGAAETVEKMSRTAAAAGKDMADAAFDSSTFQVPEVLRSFAEQGLTQTREAYGRMKMATEEATGVMEESFETTRESMRDVQFKTLDAAKAHADATFEMFRQMLTVTSMADALQLQTAYARERFEALVDYTKDVQSSLSKAGTEVTKPAKVMFERALSQAKAV